MRCLDYSMRVGRWGGGGIEGPIRCGHPKQQGMVTVTRIDRSEKKRRISSSCIPWHRSEVANW